MEHNDKKSILSDHDEQATQKNDLPEYRKPELMKLEEEINWSRGGCDPSIEPG